MVEQSSTLLHKVEGSGFAAFHRRFPGGSILEKHVHHFPLFSVTLAGGSREYAGASVLDMTAGTARFAPRGLEHRVVIGRGGEELCAVEFTAEFARGDVLPDTTIFERREGPLHELGRNIVRELVVGDEFTTIAVEGILLELFASIHRKSDGEPRAPAWLRRTVERLRSESQPVTVAELAREAGVHPGHLSRTFVRHLHRRPAEYQRYVRIDRAMDLLRSTQLTIGSIALQLGFYDETHFGRVFKQVTGWTPSAFRKIRK